MKKAFHVSVLSLSFVFAYSLSARAQIKSPAPAEPQAGATTAEATENAAATNDKALRTQIETQLAKDTAFQDLTVDVNHGVATLKGRVAARADRDRAKEVVGGIRGVAEVKDFVQIGGAPSASAHASNSTAQPAAGANPAPSSTTPASTEENAAGAATQNAGAASTNNHNENKGANPESSGATMPTTSSAGGGNISGLPQSDIETAGGSQGETLQSEIENAYSKEPTLANSSIGVKVTPSEIQLSGKAENSKQKSTARRIAQSYANNRRVVDKVTVSTNPPAQTPQQK